jgi:curved DNA-binding protein CbpA
MANPVRALSSHYETLQVPPGATRDEIAEAFASQMRTARMRPDISVVRLAQLSVAYETLRDPAKRATYDASIGLKREPAPPLPNPTFIGTPVVARLNRIAEPWPDASSRQEPAIVRPEPRVASFIAASLREPVGSSRPRQPAPVSRPEPPPVPETAIEPLSTPVGERLEIEKGRVSIGRTGATFAAGVIGVAILAFAAALPERNPDRLPVQVAQAEPGLTVPLPPPTANKDSFIESPPSGPMSVSSASKRVLPRSEGPVLQEKAPPATWLAVKEQQPAAPVGNQSDAQSLPTQAVAQQPADASSVTETPAAAAADTSTVSAAVATLPLTNATIARTIERIGYGCGRVVSATGVEGTSGAFNITCSSGDTYRAAPVHGRYHFRRTASH